MNETCLIIHDPSMRPGPESNRGPLDEYSTTELTIEHNAIFNVGAHGKKYAKHVLQDHSKPFKYNWKKINQ